VGAGQLVEVGDVEVGDVEVDPQEGDQAPVEVDPDPGLVVEVAP
jgi:hypothetical protein